MQTIKSRPTGVFRAPIVIHTCKRDRNHALIGFATASDSEGNALGDVFLPPAIMATQGWTSSTAEPIGYTADAIIRKSPQANAATPFAALRLDNVTPPPEPECVVYDDEDEAEDYDDDDLDEIVEALTEKADYLEDKLLEIISQRDALQTIVELLAGNGKVARPAAPEADDHDLETVSNILEQMNETGEDMHETLRQLKRSIQDI